MAGLQLSDPFEGFEDMFKSMWRPVRFEMVAPAPSIKLELSETDDAYQVKAQIPGVNKDDIKVKIDGDTVSISAETKQQKEEKKNGKVIKSEFQYGAASRSFSLATDVDAAKAEAKYENGILQLTLPKKASSAATTLAVK
jgi:HSP20 family protein